MSEVESKKLDLYECQCKQCPLSLSYICGLLAKQYCSYNNCIVPEPSEW